MATLRTGTYGNYYGSVWGYSEPLTKSEMETNALYIHKALTDKGWTKNSICALLGNMQAESSLNPGRWQSDAVGHADLGFGLVQWTPSTKYTNWCFDNNLDDYASMDSNLARIEYEVQHNLQWIKTDAYSISFPQFKYSKENVSYLAKAFLLNYERPADQSADVQTYRSSLAEGWYKFLEGEPTTPETPGTSTSKKKRKYNFLIFQARQRRNLWTRTNF